MKKASLILGFLLSCIIFIDSAGAVPPESFDVAVQFLETRGMIQGYGEGDPRTLEYINRAEAIKILIESEPTLKSYIPRVASSLSPLPLFPDLDQKAWYAPYAEIAFRAGLVKGYRDGNFWPQGGVRFSEAAAMIVRAEQIDGTAPFQSSQTVQNIDGQWYTSAVNALLQKNAVETRGMIITPSTYLTRGQFFDIVYRIQQGSTSFVQNPAPRSVSIQSSASSGVVPTLSVPPRTTTSVQPRVIASSSVSSSAQPMVTTVAPLPTRSTPPATSAQTTQPVAQASQQNVAGKTFHLSIPSIGIEDLTVTHPTDTTTQKGVLAVLQKGVGHLFGFPGDGGKVLVYGHSSSYPWDVSPYTKIFRGINKVAIGDLITVVYEGKTMQYQVSQKKTVLAKDRSEFEPDQNGEELILYTCWPPDSITHRFLVIAKPVNQVAGR